MEEVKGFDGRTHLINELLQGLEFANQLRNQLMNPTSSSSSSSSCDDYNNQVALNNSLVEKLLSSFDKTITIAKLLHIQLPQDPSSIIDPNHNFVPSLESPHSLTISSPNSENSHPDSPALKRRRPMMPKWTKTVQISNGGEKKGFEGALEDGYSWRKYGQKDILGAKFPRGYYRCTHRGTKGCAAMKQVQRSDEDPSIYQIMYRGEHTCSQGTHLMQDQFNPIIPPQIKVEPQPPLSPQLQGVEVYVGLGPEGDLKVGPEPEPENHAQIFRSYSFTSTHLQPDPIENYVLSFCPTFGSPTTSESNYLPLSPCHTTQAYTGLTPPTSDTDVYDAISGPNSVTNSPVKMDDFEFPIDEFLDFGGNFSFEL